MKRFFLLLLAVAVGLSAEASVLGSLPTSCAPNEIIYTTQYGYPLTLPNPDIVGETGANLMDNQYKDGIGRLIFDSDVKNIPNNMFSGSSSLVGVVLPPSVTSIGERAFEGCTHLTAISMLGSVYEIGTSAFYGCDIREVNISDLEAWCTIRFDSEPWHYVQVYNNYNLVTDLTISSWSRINNYTFYGWCSLTNVTISDGVDYIGNCAFAYCDSLSSITIPNGVVTLGNCCFFSCEALTSVTIPDSVTSIGQGAFAKATI